MDNLLNLSPLQIENTRVAYSIMFGIPAERIELSTVRKARLDKIRINISDDEMLNSCGTVGCIAGWLSAHPYFRDQGLVWEIASNILYADEFLFGDSSLFVGGKSGLPGKKEALARLRVNLLHAGAITMDRNYELIQAENSLKN